MPFAVFRRHQRKLLAVFAILAMLGFVLADSLPKLLSGGYTGRGGDPVVTTLYGKSIHRGDLGAMAAQRTRANAFLVELNPFFGRAPFGDTTTRALVDALILEHEADRLGMPLRPDLGREFLREMSAGAMNKETFDAIARKFSSQVTGEQLLLDLANQVRISQVRRLFGKPVVTPLDIFEEYRAQNERVSARIVGFSVEDFASKVPEPSLEKVTAYYEKYKDVLPEPARDTPGFKVPRQIKVEILSIDGAALIRKHKDQLTDAELRTYYENRKPEFTLKDEFPPDLFADDPNAELSPPTVQPFADVRVYLATSLAEDKARAEIGAKFDRVKEEVLNKDADKYYDALDEISEAKKEGKTVNVALPTPRDLKPVAASEGLQLETSPLLTRELAENFGEISGADVGTSRLSGGRKFAVEFFDAKTALYEPVELTDVLNRHFLARKIEDHPPRVPPLDEVRAQVTHAWKLEQARALTEQAARTYAEALGKDGGKIKEETVNGRPVISTPAITRMQPGFPIPGQMFQMGPSSLTDFPQIPYAGDEFRNAYFDLERGRALVAPNAPKTTYYVLALNQRIPATFATLYAPNGEYPRYQREAMIEAQRHGDEEWMKRLRAEAGLPADWAPSDEANKEPRES